MAIGKYTLLIMGAVAATLALSPAVPSHPLGNFTINQYARIEPRLHSMGVRYVVDMAEIPTFQELQSADADGDGSCSESELNAYAASASAEYAAYLSLSQGGSPRTLEPLASRAEIRPGTGGLSTLRIECDYVAQVEIGDMAAHFRFENANFGDRLGWREVVILPAGGVSVFDSSAFGNGLTNELKAYPEDSLTAPLDERTAEFSVVAGQVPRSAQGLRLRDGRAANTSRDRLAELISVREVTPAIALMGLLIAAALGALHALSPGHGKTVVGAYLVGSRGTARHAAFLGLTVTLTHTVGVFALGLVTLFASRYVLPESLYPILSLASGAIVVAIGLTLFVSRLRSVLFSSTSRHKRHRHTFSDADQNRGEGAHAHCSDHSQGGTLDHSHSGVPESGLTHSHGGRVHSHLPPGADGSPVSWRSLLALGVSGGLLPCPSALVVLLSAISLHRVGYGLLLVIAFSAGLATTLTAVGLAFVYAGRLMKRSIRSERLVKVLPVCSALIISIAGAVICYGALTSLGFKVDQLWPALSGLIEGSPPSGPVSTASLLAIGLVFGIKHATEADHLAAVSTIVSERRSVASSAVIGALWGVGHTVSLMIAGVAVLLLHLKIGEKLALSLELCVGVMLIVLGANTLRRIVRGGKVHIHAHAHGARLHSHFHIHEDGAASAGDSHHRFRFYGASRVKARPVIVGMVHGLAGSSALVVMVVSAISTPLAGLGFIAVFGAGSIFGMLLMSALISLPFRFTASRFQRAGLAVQILAGVFSVVLGGLMVYQIGFLHGLL